MTRIYFEFLHYCLDDTMPLPNGVDAINWNNLYLFAKKQSLVGIYYKGIRRLPNGTFTDVDLLAKWAVMARKIQLKNAVVTIATSKISNLFAEHGYRAFILKGQGNALMYPEPQLRSPGDIDIFVEGGDEKVISLCRKKLMGGRAYYHHIEVQDVDAVSVEVHYRPSFLLNPIHNRRLQKWFDANADLQCSNRVTVNVGDKECTFAVPTAAFNIIYQLLHMEKHVLQSGLGLRQIVDYYQLLMTADIETVQSPTIQEELKQFGLTRFAGAIMWVLQTVLAIPDERMIAEPYTDFGNVILNDMLEGGNFGHHAKITSWKRDTQLGRNIQRLERDMKLCWYYPSEALSEPFFRLYHFLWRLSHN